MQPSRTTISHMSFLITLSPCDNSTRGTGCNQRKEEKAFFKMLVKVHQPAYRPLDCRKCRTRERLAHSAAQANQFSICNEKGGVEAQQNDQAEGPTLTDLQVYQTCAIVCMTMPQHTPSHAIIARNHHMQPSRTTIAHVFSNNFIAMRQFNSWHRIHSWRAKSRMGRVRRSKRSQGLLLLHRRMLVPLLFRLPRLLLCQIRLLFCLSRRLVSMRTHQFSECDVCLMPAML